MTGPKARIGVIGTALEAGPTLQLLLASDLVELAVVVTNPTQPRPSSGASSDLVAPACAAGVPVVLANDVNERHVVSAINAMAVDLLVAVGWNRLIGRDLLAVPARGCVGFHASMLPLNRGHAPVNWAILRGEHVTGNTMMLLDAGVDTGDIVAQRTIPIGPDDTCGTIYRQVARAGADMLSHHLPRLLDGTVPRRPQQSAGSGHPLPRRTPDMGVIDWDRPPRSIHDWVRALTVPYPGAFTRLDARPVMIWATRCPGVFEPLGSPGELLRFEQDGIRVGTRAGSLVVTRMSNPGERPVAADRWCRRSHITPGRSFDPVSAELSRWALGEGVHAAMSA